MACEYPDASSPAELWENVLAGRRAFRRLPAERLRLDDYLSADRSAPDRIYSSEAAVIEGYSFDRVGFRVSGPTFRAADMAHWLALDVACRALADAGFGEGGALPRDRTGVILGNTLTGEFSRAGLMRLRWPYVRRVLDAELGAAGIDGDPRRALLERIEAGYKRPFEPVGDETLAGGLSNTIAGRICNHLDLHGGGYTVDGACAASLLAITTACAQLSSGDLDVAIAGGVDLSLDPFELVGFAKVGALAPEEMRVYDARAAGFWPGEGCGMIVLMRVDDAVAGERRVHAVVRGWGVSSDGAGGLTRPEHDGQLLAVQRAYRRAGVRADRVALFEGHGTGTAVGDATELRVLATARAHACGTGHRGPPAAVGSIKANIGHTKAAAGVAGVLKAALALREGVIPPVTGAERPHPELERAAGLLRVARTAEPWPEALPLRAGVSAMGFGGINSHVVLDGPGRPAPRAPLRRRVRMLAASAQDAELFVFAAGHRAELLRELEALRAVAPHLSRAELADAAATYADGATRSPSGRFRVAIVAGTPSDLAERVGAAMRAVDALDQPVHGALPGVFVGQEGREPRIGLLLPGQGSPSHVDGGALRRRFPIVEDLYTQVPSSAGTADSVATEIAQPAIVAASLGALRVLAALGIEAEVAVGHSLGEITALAWAGAFDEASAQRIAAARGRAMAELADGDGAMASLAADVAAATRLAAGLPVVVAGINAPDQTVLAGAAGAIEAVVGRARQRGVDATRLRVSHAFHSPLVAPAAGALERMLEKEAIRSPTRPVVSTITGRRLTADDDVPALLRSQVTSPVLFAKAVETASAGLDLLIEAGPGRVLSGLAGRSCAVRAIALDAGDPSLEGLLNAVAAAWTLGAPVRLDALFDGRFTRPFDPRRELRFLANPCERAPVGEPLPAPSGEASAGGSRPHGDGPQPEHTDEDGTEVVRQLVAERAELPAEAVEATSRMLDDLHLTSIVVSEIAIEAARRLGLPPPLAPNELANATVAEIAAALADPRRETAPSSTVEPPGAAPWVRAFTVEWVERALAAPPPDGRPGRWQVFAHPDDPLAQRLERALRARGGEGVALSVPPHADSALELILDAARAALDAPRFLVVQQADGRASAMARTVSLEARDCGVAVVTAPPGSDMAEIAASEAVAATGFVEARYDAAGRRFEPVARHMPVEGLAPLPIGPDDVVLTTGGAKGIAAECVLPLARSSGAAVAIVGRSDANDQQVLATLERFDAAGVRARYFRADVTDERALREAVSAMGAVTAVVHAAGINEPRLLAGLDLTLLEATLAPKVKGLENVLAAVNPDRLRMVVTFGSIIARIGMKGDAHYALANEWQSAITERFAADHPGCTCLAFESSVWAAVGMGERLGSVGALAEQGVQAIPPAEGAGLLEALLRTSGRPTAVIATGRFGSTPTLRLERPELPLLRFVERPVVHYPGVELVVDAELSEELDPYLADHVLDGDRLLPAVIGLEAMAQATRALTGSSTLPAFEDLRLLRPLVVPPGRGTVVRIAVLADSAERGVVAVRSERSGFAVDHMTARWNVGGGAREPAPSGVPLDSSSETVELDPDELYGGMLFQSGRFRRLRGYRRLTSLDCIAEIDPAEPSGWFGRFLPQELVLGDPGARDAALHAVQACIPHVRVVPVAVAAVRPCATRAPGPWTVHAREHDRSGNEFVYDLTIAAADGSVRERWDGLRLRAIATKVQAERPWPQALLAPFVERHLSRGLRVALGRSDPDTRRRERSEAALAEALGRPVHLLHRPDGKPEECAGDVGISTAHADGLTFAVAGPGTVACDLELVTPRAWEDVLGGDRAMLSRTLAAARDEDPDSSAARVWAAVECLTKAGVAPPAPLTLRRADDDGWVILASGRHLVGTYVARLVGTDAPLALAVLAEDADARV